MLWAAFRYSDQPEGCPDEGDFRPGSGRQGCTAEPRRNRPTRCLPRTTHTPRRSPKGTNQPRPRTPKSSRCVSRSSKLRPPTPRPTTATTPRPRPATATSTSCSTKPAGRSPTPRTTPVTRFHRAGQGPAHRGLRRLRRLRAWDVRGLPLVIVEASATPRASTGSNKRTRRRLPGEDVRPDRTSRSSTSKVMRHLGVGQRRPDQKCSLHSRRRSLFDTAPGGVDAQDPRQRSVPWPAGGSGADRARLRVESREPAETGRRTTAIQRLLREPRTYVSSSSMRSGRPGRS